MAIDYGPLLERAMQEEIGLAVEVTNDPSTMQVTIQHYIQNNPQYKPIMICIPSIPHHVFLVQRSVELDP